MKSIVKNITSAYFLAATLVVMPGLAPPAHAQIYYPWCAVYGGGDEGGGTNCGFSTLEQCRATISGMAGFCERNQFYTGRGEKPARRVRKRDRD